MGCRLSVELDAGRIISVTGNTCKRGEEYAQSEVINPVRVVTTTVMVRNGQSRTISVKTRTGISKNKVFDCMMALKGVTIEAPVVIGDVIAADIAGTGVDIVATSNCRAAVVLRKEAC